MKPGAVLINCARGGLVDEAALAEALKAGRLFGAGIDAFSQEPPVGSPLLELDNTVVTSHLAGATLDNFAVVVARGGGERKGRACAANRFPLATWRSPPQGCRRTRRQIACTLRPGLCHHV